MRISDYGVVVVHAKTGLELVAAMRVLEEPAIFHATSSHRNQFSSNLV
jgi:hypothetical protein